MARLSQVHVDFRNGLLVYSNVATQCIFSCKEDQLVSMFAFHSCVPLPQSWLRSNP